MRLVSRVGLGFAGSLLVLMSLGWFRAGVAWAALPPVTDPTDGFEDIVGTNTSGSGAVGLIFANICPNPRVEGITDTCECRRVGQCTLDNILQVFVNITIFILGISGSIILLMFVYGGYLWVTSRGDSKRIEKGRDTITQAVIGFAIVLLSYSIINFLIAAWAGDEVSETIEETIDKADDNNSDLTL